MYDPQSLKHLTDASLSTKTSLNVSRFTALTVQQQTLQQLNIKIQLSQFTARKGLFLTQSYKL